MIVLALLLPALAMGLLAVALAMLARHRIGALEAAGEDAEQAGGLFPFAIAGAVILGASLVALPFVYVIYVIATAPTFD